jgi:hypothetical protein
MIALRRPTVVGVFAATCADDLVGQQRMQIGLAVKRCFP